MDVLQAGFHVFFHHIWQRGQAVSKPDEWCHSLQSEDADTLSDGQPPLVWWGKPDVNVYSQTVQTMRLGRLCVQMRYQKCRRLEDILEPKSQRLVSTVHAAVSRLYCVSLISANGYL